MQYFATHYWQSGVDHFTSLLLQQAYHKRRRMPVVLACICTDTEKRKALPRELVDWFYGKGLPLCAANGEKGIETVVNSLESVLKQMSHSNSKKLVSSFAGILCVGHSFILFRQGEQRICLLNTRNNRSHCHDLPAFQKETDGLSIQAGTVQKGVGILLATAGFQACVPCNIIEECLNVRELCSQNQLDRRLRELGKFAEQNGGVDMGAVLVVTH